MILKTLPLVITSKIALSQDYLRNTSLKLVGDDAHSFGLCYLYLTVQLVSANS